MNEFKKLFGNRSFAFILLIFLLLNAFLCFMNIHETVDFKELKILKIAEEAYRKNGEEIEEKQAYYENYERNYMEELKKWQTEHHFNKDLPMPVHIPIPYTYSKEYNDYELFKIYFKNTTNSVDRKENLENLIEENEKKLFQLQKEGYSMGEYAPRTLYEIKKIYSSCLNEMEEGGERHLQKTWEVFFRYKGTGVLAVLFGILVGSRVFLLEKDSGMAPIIRCSKKGRILLAFKKSAFIAGITFSGALLMILSTMAVVFLRIGVSDPRYALWQIGDFIRCPQNITILEALFSYLFYVFLSSLFFALLTATCSLLFRNSLATLLLNFGIMMISYIFIGTKNNFLSLVNPLFPLQMSRFYEFYRMVSLFSIPASALSLITISLIVFSVVLLLLLLLFWDSMEYRGMLKIPFTKKEGEALRILKERLIEERNKHHFRRMFPLEIRKVLSNMTVTVLLLLIAFKGYQSFQQMNGEKSYTDDKKEYYMEKYGAEDVATPIENVEKALERYQLVRSDGYMNEMSLKYTRHEITEDEYNAFILELSDAQMHEKSLGKYLEELEYLNEKQMTLKDAHLRPIMDYGLYDFFEKDFDYVLFFALLLLFASVYAREKETNILPMLRTFKKGRMVLFGKKLAATLLLSLLVSIILVGMDFIALLKNYDLDMSAPLVCSMRYKNVNSAISVGNYLILVFLFRILGSLLLSLLIFSLSTLLLSTWMTAGATVLFLVPYFVKTLGVKLPEILDFTGVLSVDRLWLYGAKIGKMIPTMTMYFLLWSVLVLSLVISAMITWKRKKCS